jgi:hypothetical protein
MSAAACQIMKLSHPALRVRRSSREPAGQRPSCCESHFRGIKHGRLLDIVGTGNEQEQKHAFGVVAFSDCPNEPYPSVSEFDGWSAFLKFPLP